MKEMKTLKFPNQDEPYEIVDAYAREQIDTLHQNKLDKSAMTDIEAFIHNTIYGFIDGSIENITNNKAVLVRDYAFYQHQNLVTAEFPAATNIGAYSFYKCLSLESMVAQYVTNIGVFAFKGCNALESANYQLVETIGQGAFDECTVLSSVNFPLVTTIEPLTFRKCAALTTVNLPVVVSIGTQAFYDSGITSLTLCSNTVVNLENEDAFYFTPIENGTGYIYVPANLVDSYKAADGWSVYANQIVAIA